MGRDLALVRPLREAYMQAAEGDVMVRIHLFGIRYAADLEGVNLKELTYAAEVPESFVTEIRKGMRLADYVTLK